MCSGRECISYRQMVNWLNNNSGSPSLVSSQSDCRVCYLRGSLSLSLSDINPHSIPNKLCTVPLLLVFLRPF